MRATGHHSLVMAEASCAPVLTRPRPARRRASRSRPGKGGKARRTVAAGTTPIAAPVAAWPNAASAQAPAAHGPPTDGGHRAWMATVQVRGRPTIREPLAHEARQRRPGPVADHRARFVTAPPSLAREAPDQVDVLAHPHVRVEAAGGGESLDADDHRRSRNVRHPGGGRDAALERSEVERVADGVVPGEHAWLRRSGGDDPGSGEGHPIVVEMGQHRSQPAGDRLAICVEEGDQRGGRGRQPRHAGARRAQVGVVA